MSLTYGFYDAVNHDRQYNAQQMSAIFDGIINDGVFQSVGDKFMVSPTSGMTIKVGSGRAWFNHTWSNNDADVALTINPAHPTLTRIDAIVLEVNNTEAVRANSFKVIAGTPAVTPQRPVLVNSDGVYQHALAYVTINNAVTSIVASKIQNVVGTSQTPYVTAILQTTNVDNLLAQWEGMFMEWFQDVQSQLEGDVATNLLNKINQRVQKAGDTMTGSLNMGGNKVYNIGTPVNSYDATPKSYVDGLHGGQVGDVVETIANVANKTGTWLKTDGSYFNPSSYPEMFNVRSNDQNTMNYLREAVRMNFLDIGYTGGPETAFSKVFRDGNALYILCQVYEEPGSTSHDRPYYWVYYTMDIYHPSWNRTYIGDITIPYSLFVKNSIIYILSYATSKYFALYMKSLSESSTQYSKYYHIYYGTGGNEYSSHTMPQYIPEVNTICFLGAYGENASFNLCYFTCPTTVPSGGGPNIPVNISTIESSSGYYFEQGTDPLYDSLKIFYKNGTYFFLAHTRGGSYDTGYTYTPTLYYSASLTSGWNKVGLGPKGIPALSNRYYNITYFDNKIVVYSWETISSSGSYVYRLGVYSSSSINGTWTGFQENVNGSYRTSNVSLGKFKGYYVLSSCLYSKTLNGNDTFLSMFVDASLASIYGPGFCIFGDEAIYGFYGRMTYDSSQVSNRHYFFLSDKYLPYFVNNEGYYKYIRVL